MAQAVCEIIPLWPQGCPGDLSRGPILHLSRAFFYVKLEGKGPLVKLLKNVILEKAFVYVLYNMEKVKESKRKEKESNPQK